MARLILVGNLVFLVFQNATPTVIIAYVVQLNVSCKWTHMERHLNCLLGRVVC